MKKKKLLKRIEGFDNKITTIDEPIHFKTIANGDFKIPIIKKYCKECKYPILRLDKLVTVLKNGQRVFRYEK